MNQNDFQNNGREESNFVKVIKISPLSIVLDIICIFLFIVTSTGQSGLDLAASFMVSCLYTVSCLKKGGTFSVIPPAIAFIVAYLLHFPTIHCVNIFLPVFISFGIYTGITKEKNNAKNAGIIFSVMGCIAFFILLFLAERVHNPDLTLKQIVHSITLPLENIKESLSSLVSESVAEGENANAALQDPNYMLSQFLKPYSNDDIVGFFDDLIYSLKMSLPSIFIVLFTVYCYLCTVFTALLAKIFGEYSFIKNCNYKVTMSFASANIYIFLYFMMLVFSYKTSAIYFTLSNMLNILTPGFAVTGLSSISSYLMKKVPKSLCILIMIIIVTFVIFTFSIGLYVLVTIGLFSILRSRRNEFYN